MVITESMKIAVAAGYKYLDGLKKNKDLHALRDREDFKKILNDVEGRVRKRRK